MSTNQRIRGRALQGIRARILRADPLCSWCRKRGLVTAATEVDHIVPIKDGGEDVDENRQGLCDACHDEKTRDDLGQRKRIGCDVNGYPIGDHHWNRTEGAV